MPRLEERRHDSDVLVIGGGLAGCMAGIRAAELGARTIVAEKADTVRSGCAGMGVDHCWTYIPEIHERELSIADLVADHVAHAGGFVDPEIATFIATHSFERMLDLERFGVPIRDDQGRFRLIKKIHRVPTFLHFAGRDMKVRLTHQMRVAGVDIVNRVMMTDLLVDDGRVTGALGVDTRTAELHLFRAKAVILATGNIYRLYPNHSGMPFNLAFPPHETGDGHAMARRAGAELLNMEFTTFQTGPRSFHRCGRGTFVPGQVIDGRGQPVGAAQPADHVTMDRAVESEHEFEQILRQGRGPIYIDCSEATDADVAVIRWGLQNEGNWALLDYMDERGIDLQRDPIEFEVYPPKGGSGKAGIAINPRCETALPGLYAAGDVIGGVTRAVAPGALTLGWHAAEVAVDATAERDPVRLGDQAQAIVAARRGLCESILSRDRGATWREGQAALQSHMDYYVGRIRSDAMLGAGLARLRRLRDESVQELCATSPHELQRCLEVLSLIDAGESIAVSARARQESRFGPEHFRADYPETDDEQWLCNTVQRWTGDRVELSKRSIPGQAR